MTLVYPGWSWYVAQLVIESHVEGRNDSIVLIESVLVHAESPDGAYAKAESLCASSEHIYRNRLGQRASQRYVGIHDLDSLQAEQPEDGLVLQVRVAGSTYERDVSSLVRARAQLTLFGGERPEVADLDQ